MSFSLAQGVRVELISKGTKDREAVFDNFGLEEFVIFYTL